jgi:hypothetical protein
MSLVGGGAKRVAMRSRWLTRRLWMIAVAESAFLLRRHWVRLEPEERSRLRGLARKSKGKPSNLSKSERAEADALLDKLGHAELAGGLVNKWVPFRVGGLIAEKLVDRTARVGDEPRS